MEKLNNKLLQEIVDDSNHKDIESVREFIANGDIEIYENKEEYKNDGNSLEFKDYYTILSNGYIAHYVE